MPIQAVPSLNELSNELKRLLKENMYAQVFYNLLLLTVCCSYGVLKLGRQFSNENFPHKYVWMGFAADYNKSL